MGKLTWRIVLVVLVLAGAIYSIFTRPVNLGLDLQGGTQITLQAKSTNEVPRITTEVLQGLEVVIQQRIDGLGVAEALIQRSGEERLFVQLPGVDDPERAIEILGDTAQLDFRQQKIGTVVPRDDFGLPIAGDDPDSIFERVGLTGGQLNNAFPQAPIQAGGSWQVAIEFDNEGATKFSELTRNIAGTGRTIGIFLDETLISAPTVGAEFARLGITGGNAVITGNFDTETATDLAIKLRAGALPVPVEVVENRTVGATLGEKSIRQSLYAGIGGLVLTLTYMLVYYRIPGLMADIALLVYATCTFALFQLLGVTLTLPGIAGFILSIGIAVDANVLIFERTREELKLGKTLYKSVEEGFSRALSSIVDSNVTTLLACGVLFWLGTGLVKGFAVTLGIGILVSFFSAITCTRTFLLMLLTSKSLRRPEIFGVTPELAK
ncbi:MAG: protein translocase subunit SecD [Cyanobacteria bacterium J06642_2]